MLDLAAASPFDADAHWPSMDAATRDLDAPLAALSLSALAANAADLVRRASGTPIRVASKSVRCRAVLDAVLAQPGWHGILAYTLSEALWLAETCDDVVVGYPSVDRAAIAALAASERLASRVTIMVDDPAQLDLVDAVAAPRTRATIRVALELDASWRGPLGHVGPRRSPVHAAADLDSLARVVADRPGFSLVGVMAYEGQIAGVGDAASAVVRAMQRVSAAELAERRADAVARVRRIADLAFVNGGGTGSLERTSAEPAVTEVAAGSGLFGPGLFDGYRGFQPAPALAIALPVVRRPSADVATLQSGGWIASGPVGADRQPTIAWPRGLATLAREGFGEVQTPVRGDAARDLRIGDRVWMRHAKAGEACEHVDALHVVDGDATIAAVPTYRGEGRTFR
ncbi:alanine racemase [Agrococcus sp. SGAir0287]|uniref:alanine racemase n=1 Tax=Agrococcus sp. SGAir0287 TaxID=2070347 RepID=UPI0010CCD101|nr:alanine racemase [Agrococcus sp. SGAir0287]QCR18726.1 alanine racemase [Agrococcus sp. SGAir0287]